MEGQKLSKKERKTLAFRERKGKLRAQQTQLDVPEEDVPNEQQSDPSFGSGESTGVKRKQTGDRNELGPPTKRQKKAVSEDQEATKSTESSLY